MTGNRLLFDTTVFVDYLRGKSAAQTILMNARLPGVTAGYSILTEVELWYGITGAQTTAAHTLVLKPFTRYFVNVAIAHRAGTIQRLVEQAIRGIPGESPPSLVDSIIAATAEYHNLTIVTRNQKHFKHFQALSIQTQFYKI